MNHHTFDSVKITSYFFFVVLQMLIGNECNFLVFAAVGLIAVYDIQIRKTNQSIYQSTIEILQFAACTII